MKRKAPTEKPMVRVVAVAKMLEDLDARSSLDVSSRNWTGWVFNRRGERVVQCLHPHANSTLAKNCAAKLAKRWAEFEAARGVRP